jgi:hypothetical protein
MPLNPLQIIAYKQLKDLSHVARPSLPQKSVFVLKIFAENAKFSVWRFTVHLITIITIIIIIINNLEPTA